MGLRGSRGLRCVSRVHGLHTTPYTRSIMTTFCLPLSDVICVRKKFHVIRVSMAAVTTDAQFNKALIHPEKLFKDVATSFLEIFPASSDPSSSSNTHI